MHIGYIVDTLTSVDFLEMVQFGRKVVEYYEGVTYRENVKVSPFRKVNDFIFELLQKYKEEHNDVT